MTETEQASDPTAHADGAMDDGVEWEEPAWPAVKRQLVLLGVFLLCAGLLFVLVAAALPGGEGCGGG